MLLQSQDSSLYAFWHHSTSSKALLLHIACSCTMQRSHPAATWHAVAGLSQAGRLQDVMNVKFSVLPSMQTLGDEQVTLGWIFAAVGVVRGPCSYPPASLMCRC